MSMRQPRYSKEEHARRGREIYEQHIRSLFESGNRDKIVAIDIETSEYEVASDSITAADRLLARLPDAQIWYVRIGHPTVLRFGGPKLIRVHERNNSRE